MYLLRSLFQSSHQMNLTNMCKLLPRLKTTLAGLFLLDICSGMFIWPTCLLVWLGDVGVVCFIIFLIFIFTSSVYRFSVSSLCTISILFIVTYTCILLFWTQGFATSISRSSDLWDQSQCLKITQVRIFSIHPDGTPILITCKAASFFTL